MGPWRKWNIDASRHEREILPAVDYLGMSYYESWTVRLERQLIKSGLVTRTEIEAGKPDTGAAKATPALPAEMVPELIRKGSPANRNVAVVARFKGGQHVRARNIHPPGHTRLPRYARGKTGIIIRDHGVFVFPDTNAHFKGENPQHLYSVRFAARELWGAAASPKDSIYIDMWEDYLDHA